MCIKHDVRAVVNTLPSKLCVLILLNLMCVCNNSWGQSVTNPPAGIYLWGYGFTAGENVIHSVTVNNQSEFMPDNAQGIYEGLWYVQEEKQNAMYLTNVFFGDYGWYPAYYMYIDPYDSCHDVEIIEPINGKLQEVGNAYQSITPSDTIQFIVHNKLQIVIDGLVVKDGIYQFPVTDGKALIRPYVKDPAESTPPIVWFLACNDTNNLGCMFNTNTGVVTVGTQPGMIYIVASSATCTESLAVNLGCSACQKSTCSSSACTINSLDVSINLGWSSVGNSAGSLTIYQQTPSASTLTLKSLQYNYTRPDVSVFANPDGSLHQVLAPECLANMVSNSPSQFTVELYTLNEISGSGPYQISGSPYRTVVVSNPGNNTNQVQVTDTTEGSSTISTYNWLGDGWELITGNGLRHEVKTDDWSQSNTLDTVTRTIKDASGNIASQTMEKWQVFPWGKSMIQQVAGLGACARTNTYSYTTNGFVQQNIRGDGSWEYNVYDDQNRPTNINSSFLNQSLTTNSSLCRLVVNDYSTNQVAGSGDTGLLEPYSPRRTIEYLLGQEVGRTYHVFLDGETDEIRCTKPGALWNDTNNLVTVTQYYLAGDREGEVQSVKQADGTIAIYNYDGPPTSMTNTVLVGHPDFTGTNIDAGTKTVSMYGSAGQLLSEQTIDVVSGVTLAVQTYAYDNLNRMTNTTYLDGTSSSQTYDCCNVTATTDRDGSSTYYLYDALKRQIGTQRNNILVQNTLDPIGNVLMTVRYGTNGAAITNQMATYDTSGSQTFSSDALGNTTLYTNYIDGIGQTVRQTTNPDLSTRVETYASDGSLLNVSGPAVHPVRYVYGVEDDGSGIQHPFTQTIPLNANGTDSQEWTKTYTDTAGRSYKTLFADGAANITTFNQLGQVASTVDPDAITQLIQYNSLGQPVYNAVDMEQNGQIDFAGTDRITFTTNDVIADHGTFVRRTQTFVWATNRMDSPLLTDTVEQDVTGLRTWDVSFGLTNFSQTSYLGNGLVVTTQVAPDGSQSVSTNLNGQLISVTQLDGAGGQIGQSVYGYDAFGRQFTVTDARTGTTTTSYTALDQVQSVTTPVPAGGQSAQVTTNLYDNMGRAWKTVLPDNSSVTNLFLTTGELQETFGSRTYPVAYTYDYAGRMKTMQTWQNFAGNTGVATTAWNYDSLRGLLVSKQYNNGQGPTYTNTPAGRLHSRTWSRTVGGQPLVTTYSYDNSGALSGISYSDGTTPNVGYTFDRLGRMTQVTDVGTRTLSYNTASEVLSDNYVAAGLGLNSQLTYGYDPLLRRTNLFNASLGANVSYSYDAASRLAGVGDGNNTASYGYVANSPLVGQVTFKQGANVRLTTTKSYDNLNRLANVLNSAAANLSSAYQYNPANQRTNQLREDGTYWVYQYDNLGQVISGKKYWSDGTPVAGQQFIYNFDNIGNRTQTQSGGDAVGSSLRLANYTNNLLNQITSRDVSGYVEDQGAASSNATITVNGTAAYQKGNYYRGELAVNNTASPVYLGITNQGTLTTNAVFINGHALVAQTPESFGYDADGNLTQDGKWTYSWDAENRLIGMQSFSSIPSAANRQMTYTYDDQGRRIYAQIMEWNTNTSSYQLLTQERYWYDGWNLIGRADLATSLVQNFIWGLDLSGTTKGAGGVGGLLMLDDSQGASYFYNYDGNGNVLGLINAQDGTVAAQYDYDPFLGVIRANGLMAKANPFLGSTKFFDAETGLYYYGYRYYDPSAGRWPNRDPIGERGGINLYRFVGNNPVNKIDPLGLYVSITTADGVTTTIPTTTGALINALQNDVNSGSQVTGIIIAGHGTPDLITLDAAQTQLLIASNGKILLVDGSNDDNTTSTDITDLLKKALAPKATIQLNACHTAKGDNNLTKDLSQILPNTPISGISTYAIGPAGGGLGTGTEGLGYGSVLGIRVTFVNGNKQ